VRAVVQSQARVTVETQVVGSIGAGAVVLLGVAADDGEAEADWLVDKLLHLRIFENELGKFDRSLRDVHGELLVVSQFTLLADTGKGRRPSFSGAARPERAAPLYEYFGARARAHEVTVATGTFGAMMDVELVNHGPVTIILDTRDR